MRVYCVKGVLKQLYIGLSTRVNLQVINSRTVKEDIRAGLIFYKFRHKFNFVFFKSTKRHLNSCNVLIKVSLFISLISHHVDSGRIFYFLTLKTRFPQHDLTAQI